jgi:serine acetyltransferase
VTIGDESYIAMAAVVRDDRTVGARATVGAGAVVVSDVPADTTVVGLPARPLAIT